MSEHDTEKLIAEANEAVTWLVDKLLNSNSPVDASETFKRSDAIRTALSARQVPAEPEWEWERFVLQNGSAIQRKVTPWLPVGEGQ